VRTPRVKICCISSHAEAALAIRYDAAIGLVSQMPSSPGVMDDALVAAIAARLLVLNHCATAHEEEAKRRGFQL
jgi:phosphoribosylanthranilate isomerase